MDNLLLPADLRKQALVNVLDDELLTSRNANTSVNRNALPQCKPITNGIKSAFQNGGFPSGAPLYTSTSPSLSSVAQAYMTGGRGSYGYKYTSN